MFKYLLILAALLELAGCAALDPNDVLTRRIGNTAPASGQPLDPATRQQAFDFVWKRVKDGYVDPNLRGLDWQGIGQQYRPLALSASNDDVFWDTLDRMTGELGDAHTRVMSARQYAHYREKQALTLGLRVREMQGEVIVTGVRKTGPAAAAGIANGDKLIEIDGQPALDWWHGALARTRKNSTERARRLTVSRILNMGSPEAPSQSVALRLERSDGSTYTTLLTRAVLDNKPTLTYKTLPSGYGYIHLSGFDATLGSALQKALSSLKATPGLVLDLRANPGGSMNLARVLMSGLVEQRIVAGKTVTRSGKPITAFMGLLNVTEPQIILQGNANAYRGKAVVLIDENSASASELTAAILKGLGRAKVVGETSCGCMLGYLGLSNVPGGGALAYSEIDFEPAAGGRIEGVGVVPDVEVPLTRANLAARKDATLDAAIALLERMQTESKLQE